MSSEFNHFENPKTAIIRLLRSQGCCSDSNKKQENSSQLEGVLRLKCELEMSVNIERGKLNQIPCVIKLSEDIEQLKQIIGGLTGENRKRMRELQLINEEYVSHKGWGQQQNQDYLQHEKLQIEYANLLKTLEITNDSNQRLIRKLAHIP